VLQPEVESGVHSDFVCALTLGNTLEDVNKVQRRTMPPAHTRI
jgi:hypothetical protein